MEINGYQTPDESSHSEDSISSLGTMSDSTFSSFNEHYPLCRELCQSLLHNNNMNNCQRLFELSPENTQHNDDCSKKLDSIIESQAELEKYLKDRRGSIPSERNEQTETLVTMNNYWDKKWHQVSFAYTNVHSTVMHIKDMTDTIENKLNANITKFEGFIQDDVPKLKQILDECATKDIVIEEILHKCYDAILNLNEVFCRETSRNAVQTEELARSLNDINNSIKNVENQLMDVKNQLDNMGKAPVTSSIQQHYPPNGSYPTSPYIPCSSKAAITPLSNSFHHVDSSHTKVDEKYLGDIHFISKRISNRENRFQRKQFPDKLLKQNTPPFCVKLEPVDVNSNGSNRVSTCHSSVSKGVSFNNNLSGSESKMDESRMFHKKANKIPQPTACSDSKTEPDQTVKKNETSNFNLPSDSKGVSSYATNTRTKSKTNSSKEYKKHPKVICYKKNSPKMVALHSVVSTSKDRLDDQDEDLRGKEQNSKRNAPISTTALDVYNSDDDDDCMIVAEVVKYPRFNYQQNIPIVQENDANTQVKPSVSDPKKTITKDNNKSNFRAFAAGSLASSSKKPSVLRSGDKKHGSKINILTTKAANHDHMVFTSNEQSVFMSEENAGNMQEKLKEFSPRVQCINNGQQNISYGKAISPAITSASGAQRPATQQSQHHKGKKRDSKESNLNAPPENAISAEVRNPQLHFRPNIRMSSENAAYNSPSFPPTSDGTRSYHFRTKDPSKRIKTESESEENFK